MKKVVLLLLVAGVIGTAGFMLIAKYFETKQIQTRINDLAATIRNPSGATRIALDRNFWASSMPPTEQDIPGDEFRQGISLGRNEWFNAWESLAAEGGGHFTRNLENFEIGESDPAARFQNLSHTVTTWTWLQGVPGEWGERVNMYAVWIYEQQEFRITKLELLGTVETTDTPQADPK